MLSALQIAKDQFDSISECQNEMHTIKKNDGADMVTPYYKKYIKTSWRSRVIAQFTSQPDGNSDIVYPVDNHFHYLEYTYLTAKLPAIRIKPEHIGKVRICWCHDPGNNMRTRAVFLEDDVQYNTIDNVWGDIHPQFFQKPGAGHRECHNMGTGIVTHLEEWSEDFLPSYDIDVDQPWFYSNDLASSYPIWMKGSLTRASHRYTFKKKVVNLLRLEIKDKNGKWIPQTKNFTKYIQIMGPETIRTPQLWGSYAYISDDELKLYNTCDDTWVMIDEEKNIKRKDFYIRDVVTCDMENVIKYGILSTQNLKCSTPCLAIFWVAENRDSTIIHNYSNYTTNTNDIYQGWDPIKKTSYKLGNTVYFNGMDSHHFSRVQSRHHFPSSPWIAGYHGYSNANDCTDFNGQNGIVYDNLTATMNCLIDNNDIYLNQFQTESDNIDDDDEDDKTGIDASSYEIVENKSYGSPSPNFIVRTRLLVVRKFTVTNNNGSYTFDLK